MATTTPRAPRTLRALSHARAQVKRWWSTECEVSQEEERRMSAEYARAMGMHLSVDEQVSDFKRRTEGAPRVQRQLRPVTPH